MVALSASRLVCAAIEWISLTTSPIFSAPVESTCTVALVRSASLTARLATSVERVTWREISATELDSSSAAAATVPTLPSFLRGGADRRRTRRGVAGGRGHRLRGGLHAGGGRGDRADDAVDAAFEVAGDALHRAATFRRGTLLGIGLGLLEAADAHRVVLEDLDGRRHRADLVAAADAGNVTLELAVGEILHAGAEQPQRATDAAADQPGDAAGDDDDAEHGKTEQPEDRAHLGVDVVEIGAGAEIHVESGHRDGVTDLADRRLLAGLHVFIVEQDRAVGLDAVHQLRRRACGRWSRLPCGWCRSASDRARAGDAVIGRAEQIAGAVVIGHRVAVAAKIGHRRILGQLAGIDPLFQR